LVKLKREKLSPGQYTGYGKNTWLTVDGAETLRLAVDAPLAVPTKLRGIVIRDAQNPRWVYVKLEGVDGKVPVAIPRRLRGMLAGKNISIDAITDAQGGTTYRHEILAG
jgi:hypothetical protein